MLLPTKGCSSDCWGEYPRVEPVWPTSDEPQRADPPHEFEMNIERMSPQMSVNSRVPV